jgi:putative phosphoribosyl transferase
MLFENRTQAARLLVAKLAAYRGQHPLVLGVPRGAVPMARIIADGLGGDVDVVLVHKLGAPGQPELAIGSVDENGHVYLSAFVGELGVSDAYLDQEIRIQLEALQRRRRLYTPIRPTLEPAGRVVIIVDDGIATGSSMIAALRAVREKKPAMLIVATAVAPPETVERLQGEADDIVCLATPAIFFAIGTFFGDFSQVPDEDVMRTLRRGAPDAMPDPDETPHA